MVRGEGTEVTKTETTTTTESIDLREPLDAWEADPQGFAEREAARKIANAEARALLADVAAGLYGGDPA